MGDSGNSVLRVQDEQRLRDFRLLDDDFMRMVFENNIEATELLLNVVLDREDLKVLSVVSQKEIKNVNGRSVRLDIFARDAGGAYYDIEVQRQNRGAGERRARFNSSMLDAKLLHTGQAVETLPDAYVIFITEQDVRGQGRPIYHFRRMETNSKELFEDGSHILYVNAAYHNEGDRIGRLMHDFRCADAGEMHHEVLADKVRYLKQTEGGRAQMSQIGDEIRAEGAYENSVAIALRMLAMGEWTIEMIAQCTGLPLEEVKALAAKRTA